jgi:hypothetical protein
VASRIVDARMRAYYEQRAGEYDDWWLGTGQFERRDRPGWGREVVVVDAALRDGVDAEERQERVLDDGTRHSVYKRFFTGDGLAQELGGGEILHDGRWFVAVAVR